MGRVFGLSAAAVICACGGVVSANDGGSARLAAKAAQERAMFRASPPDTTATVRAEAVGAAITSTWEDAWAHQAAREAAGVPRFRAPEEIQKYPHLPAGVMYENPEELSAKRARAKNWAMELAARAARGEPATTHDPDNDSIRQVDPDAYRDERPGGDAGADKTVEPWVRPTPEGPLPDPSEFGPVLNTGDTFETMRPGGPGGGGGGGGDPSGSGTPRAPAEYVSWPAVADSSRPSDADCAVGPAHVGVVVNSEIAFYTKDGTAVVPATAMEDFWPGAPAGADLFDPKIVYDQFNDRWIILALNGRRLAETYYAISISKTGNPEGEWWTYYSRSDADNGATDLWADFPGLGYDAGDRTEETDTMGWVYITTNQYTLGDSFTYAAIKAYPKGFMYDGQGFTSWVYTNMNDAAGDKAFTVKPAEFEGSGLTPPVMYFVDTESGGASVINIRSMTAPGVGGGAPTLGAANDVVVNAYLPPPEGEQPGAGQIDTGDCRTQDVIYDFGTMYTAWTESEDFGNATVESAIRSMRFTSGGSVTWQSTFGADELFYAWPNIHNDVADNVVLGFSRYGESEFANIRWTGRTAAATAFEGSAMLVGGSVNYNPSSSTVERWGDYSGLDVDQAGDRQGFFFHNQIADTGTTWLTYVGGTSYGLPNVYHFNDGGSLYYGTATERYFTFRIDSFDWAGVAIYNQIGGDNDIQVDNSTPFGSPYESTFGGTDIRDFVVTDGRDWGDVYHHARVLQFGGSVGFRYESRNVALDFGTGSSYNESFVGTEIMDLYEFASTAGKNYAMTVDIDGTSMDLDVWAFDGDRSSGSRQDFDASSQTTGGGVDEAVEFVGDGSVWGFAVINENFGSGDYTAKLWLQPLVTAISSYDACAASPFVSPAPTLVEGTTPVTWSIVSGPAGAVINSSTGVLTWPVPTPGSTNVTIRATNPAGFDNEAYTINVGALPAAPASVTASDDAFCGRIRVTWPAAAGATQYQVWRNTVNNLGTAALRVTTAATSFDDAFPNTQHGQLYYYWVRSVNSCGTSGFTAVNRGSWGEDADLNQDGEIDILDFLDFFASFGACENQPAPCGSPVDADFNGDTFVDILDFLDFFQAFGEGCTP